jgi:hypothetical protein
MLADFTNEIAGDWLAGMDTDEDAVTFAPFGGVPVAVPVLVREPASTSAWVVV